MWVRAFLSEPFGFPFNLLKLAGGVGWASFLLHSSCRTCVPCVYECPLAACRICPWKRETCSFSLLMVCSAERALLSFRFVFISLGWVTFPRKISLPELGWRGRLYEFLPVLVSLVRCSGSLSSQNWRTSYSKHLCDSDLKFDTGRQYCLPRLHRVRRSTSSSTLPFCRPLHQQKAVQRRGPVQ